MKKATKLLPLFLFLVSQIGGSCSCRQLNKEKSEQVNPPSAKNNPPSSTKNNPPPPGPIVDNHTTVDEAIKKLEHQLATAPTPDLELIYDFLRFLPPNEVKILNGKTSRINEEKNGRELFDKLLAAIGGTMDIYNKVTDWLIDQNLLDPKGTDGQPTTPILAAFGSFFTKNNEERDVSLIQHLDSKAPDLLTKTDLDDLLFKVATKQLSQTSISGESKTLIQWLQTKSGTTQLTPSKGGELFMALIDNTTLKAGDKDILLQLIREETPIPADQRDNLLKKAVTNELGIKAYTNLIKAGANPTGVKIEGKSLWNYANRNRTSTNGEQLLDALITNPQTDVNEIFEDRLTSADLNLTQAMYDAYSGFGIELIKKLLKRADFQLNGTQASNKAVGVQGYTLLDIIISNCFIISVNNNDAWFVLLAELKQHPKCSFTQANKDKFEEWRNRGGINKANFKKVEDLLK